MIYLRCPVSTRSSAGYRGLRLSHERGCDGGEPSPAAPGPRVGARSGRACRIERGAPRRRASPRRPQRCARQPRLPAVRLLVRDPRRVRPDGRRPASRHAGPLVRARDRRGRRHLLVRAVHAGPQLRGPARRDRLPTPAPLRGRARDRVGMAKPRVPRTDGLPVVLRLRARGVGRHRRVAEPRQRGSRRHVREPRVRAVRTSDSAATGERVRDLGPRVPRPARELGGGRSRDRGDRPADHTGVDRSAHVHGVGAASRSGDDGARPRLVRGECRPPAPSGAPGARRGRADRTRNEDRGTTRRAVPSRHRTDAPRGPHGRTPGGVERGGAPIRPADNPHGRVAIAGRGDERLPRDRLLREDFAGGATR